MKFFKNLIINGEKFAKLIIGKHQLVVREIKTEILLTYTQEIIRKAARLILDNSFDEENDLVPCFKTKI